MGKIKLEGGGYVMMPKAAKKQSYPKKFKKSNAKTFKEKVKQIIHNEAEKKEVLTNASSTLGASASFLTLLNGMAQGLTGITRVGLEVTHGYIEVAIAIQSVGTNTIVTPGGDCGFWAIVLDRQPNGVAAVFSDIFDTSNPQGAGLSLRITTTNQDRFKIISRNEWTVGGNNQSAATAATGAHPYHVKEYIDLSKLGLSNPLDQKANYSGTGATIASIDSGALYFVCAGCFSSANNQTTVNSQIKYRFTDV